MASRTVLQSAQVIWIILTVAANPLIEVTQVPENIYSIIGTNIAFDCTFPTSQDDLDVNIHWWKLGEKDLMRPGSDSRKWFATGNGRASFKLLNISIQDSGVYYCGVTLQGNWFTNGSGSTLVVSALPTPVTIVPSASASNVPGSLTLVCEMASFYPAGLTIIWYKNNGSIENGIHTTKQLSRTGMYEASSYFEEAQPVQGGTVYVCLVSDAALQIPAMASYIVPNCKPGRDSTSSSSYLQIFGCAGFTMMVLLLLIIMRMLGNYKARRQRTDEANSRDKSTSQDAFDNPLTYAEVELIGS
ncbi:tapasin-related protein-like [Mustelus asterias]